VPACFSHCRKSQQQTSKKCGTSYIKKEECWRASFRKKRRKRLLNEMNGIDKSWRGRGANMKNKSICKDGDDMEGDDGYLMVNEWDIVRVGQPNGFPYIYISWIPCHSYICITKRGIFPNTAPCGCIFQQSSRLGCIREWCSILQLSSKVGLYLRVKLYLGVGFIWKNTVIIFSTNTQLMMKVMNFIWMSMITF